MKYFFSFLIVVLFFFSTLYSCKKENKEQTAVDRGYSYFPDKVGNYIIYDVDSFFYNDFTDHIDTFKFQLKEKIESVFQDNENRSTMRIEQYIRFYNPNKPYPSIPWKLRNVRAANLTTSTAEKVEENIRFVKLVFPLNRKLSWNGNAQNRLAPVNYSYSFIDLPGTIGKISFDSVLQVKQVDIKNNIFKQFYIETYARNIGLIYKQVIDVESQPEKLPDSIKLNLINIPIMTRVTSGFQYILTINSYGHE